MKKATEYVILGTVCIAFAGIGSFAAQRAVNSEDRPAAETISRSLNRVSATKQDIEIVNGASAKGYVTIIIGKHPKS